MLNNQILTKIENLEKELKEVKTLLKKEGVKSKAKKGSKSLGAMMGLWKKLEITDEELEEAKKSVFDFDVEKYVNKSTI